MKRSISKSFDVLPSAGASKVIQIHPSLQCNLTCAHCYSSSAPAFKNGLDVEKIKSRVEELAAFGYNAVSLSGGEPFLYRSLEDLLRFTHSLGFFNSITTNAMLLRSDRAKKVLAQADLVAVSVDGKAEQHDKVRNFAGAFQKMEEGVAVVKDHVAYFGFIHTLFPDNWMIMPWLADFAIGHQAKLLHLHPLEMAGRAASRLHSVNFDAASLHKIFIAFHYLKEVYKDDLVMQLDLLHRDYIFENPGFAFHGATVPSLTTANFSTIFKELVIDEQGDIIPIAHGCSNYFALGNIQSDEPCSQMIERFMAEKMQDILYLYKTTYDSIAQDEEKELVNWSEVVIDTSHRLFDAQSTALRTLRRQSEPA